MRDWHPIFLEALARSPNVSRACKAAGIARRTAYAAQEADPEFAKAWQDALDAGTDNLVGECYRRAARGTREPVFHQGAQCGEIRKYSDTLAIFLLKSHRPEVYREKIEADVTSGGKPFAVTVYLPANGRETLDTSE